MGAIEEGGKALGGIVDAMRSAPLALALILVNIIFIGFMTYVLHEIAENQRLRSAASESLLTQLVRECVLKKDQQSFMKLLPK